jgi:hypothetical protein
LDGLANTKRGSSIRHLRDTCKLRQTAKRVAVLDCCACIDYFAGQHSLGAQCTATHCRENYWLQCFFDGCH